MVWARHGHGMASVNQTRPRYVNQMGKTHSKPLAARHGRGTAWARHAMCESTFTVHLTMLCCHCVLTLPIAIKCFQIVYHSMSTNSISRGKTCSFRELSHTFRLRFPITCVPKLSPELYLHSLLRIYCFELNLGTILIRPRLSVSVIVTCLWQQRITSTTTKSCKNLIYYRIRQK